jgi:hypothetical protein
MARLQRGNSFLNCQQHVEARHGMEEVQTMRPAAENAVQFGPKATNVYCQDCTCSECGIELERYEETTCQACCEKHEKEN